MAQYKTPGVYVEEKNSFGSSIVANATAIPSFIGMTEYAIQQNGDPLNKIKGATIVREPVLVRSMLEYEQTFGGADVTGDIYVKQHPDTGGYTAKNMKNSADYTPGLLYPSVSNFFSNGGGSCYIVSIGFYEEFGVNVDAAAVTADMSFIEKAIEQAETTTLILPTDLMRFGATNYYTWGTQFTNFSEQEKKYFTVLDVIQKAPNDPVYDESDILDYRNGVTPTFPSYAGGYFPNLKSLTIYKYKSDMSNVYLNGSPILLGTPDVYNFGGIVSSTATPTDQLLTSTYKTKVSANFPAITYAEDTTAGAVNSITVVDNKLDVKYVTGATAAELTTLWKSISSKYADWSVSFPNDPEAGTVVYSQSAIWKNVMAEAAFPFIVTCNKVTGVTAATDKVAASVVLGAGTTTTVAVTAAGGVVITIPKSPDNTPSASVANYSVKNPDVQLEVNPLYVPATIPGGEATELPLTSTSNATKEDVKNFLNVNYINMPPSPFMAGIYSRLDNATGVWTPPANVAPTGVTGPLVPLTNKQQEDLNVDAVAGKSINAIRSFTGKGTLVWGARTNDGNSLDWRYINVRRLFISMETDISMALKAYVFKPNVHNTWVEVKTMIESYLFGLFNDGAFAGTTPEGSYQVLIGVGETMTDEDVLNGYMRASIMVAPVRPAEFIVLTFSQMIGQ